ncbi:MAG: hypothetical protein ABL962_19165 [Fimbriimonadaceae bacterium]
MKLSTALGTTIGVTLGGGIAGALIGWLLGKFLPSYYRSVFYGGDRPDFDPVAVGIGSGVTQGPMIGALIGMGTVWILSKRGQDPEHSKGSGGQGET